MKYLFILIILFLLDCEFNYKINPYEFKDLDNTNQNYDFKNGNLSDFNFKKGRFKFKSKNTRRLFPLYRNVKERRELLNKKMILIFGEEKYNDLRYKSHSELIKKYGKKIYFDIEILEAVLKNLDFYNFKKIKRKGRDSNPR